MSPKVRPKESEGIETMKRGLNGLLISSTLTTQLRRLLVKQICAFPNSAVMEWRSSLESVGFFLGAKACERLSLDRPRFFIQRDCLKFVCREVWHFFFRKQADRLQTNKKGGYIIVDGANPWLKGYVPHIQNEGSETEESARLSPTPFWLTADAHAALMCGIIRGTLTVLDCPCSVAQDAREPPACTFHISALPNPS